MGNSYSNMTLKGTEQAAIVEVLKQMGQRAYVTPTQDGITMLYYADLVVSEGYLAHRLSKQLACTVWQVMVHDDDVLLYELYWNGALADKYNSNPGWGWGDGWLPARGGNAEALCAAFNARDALETVEPLLHGEEEFVFASDRHTALAAALGLPELPTGAEYSDFSRHGETIPGMLPVDGAEPRPYRLLIVVNVPDDMEVGDLFEPLIEQENPDFPHKMGHREHVHAALTRLLSKADFSDARYGWLNREHYTIEFDLGSDPVMTKLMLEVRGQYEAALPLVRGLCQQAGWRAFDVSGDWVM